MADGGSVTRAIARARAGDWSAAQKIWEAYFQRVVAVARARSHGPLRDENAVDVANSVIANIVKRIGRGEFPDLGDRDSLWGLLVQRACWKAIDYHRRAVDEDRVIKFSDLGDLDAETLERVLGEGPDPSAFAETTFELMDCLAEVGNRGPRLTRVAMRRLEGRTIAEIAGELDVAEVTVGRDLREIRKRWEPGEKESES